MDNQSVVKFSFPLNVYAMALWLEEKRIDYLHYGIFNSSEDTILQAQKNSTDMVVSNLPAPPCQILEVGIGLGTTAHKLAHLGYEVIGISPDKHQIVCANRFGPQQRLKFVATAFEHFLPGGKRFDVILFQESAQYIDSELLLRQSYGLLSDQGTLLIIDEAASRVLPKLEAYAVELGFTLAGKTDLTARAAPSLTYLVKLIEKHWDAIKTRLRVKDAQLENLLSSLRKREAAYQNGSYLYLFYKLQKGSIRVVK
jgi:SAM-dependent methyltransferase